MNTPHRTFINSIDAFRGIAIIIIVAGHSYGLAGWRIDTFPEKVLANIISGGTSLFVFISGFLFHHIYCRHFSYGRFLAGKFKTVLLPYLVLSAAGTIYFGWYLHPHPAGAAAGAWAAYLRPLLENLGTGAAFPPYWFVPFIFLTFVFSPLHMRFARMSVRGQLAVLGISLAMALVLQRPGRPYYHLQAVCYFTPVYLAGIICSIRREAVYRVLRHREWLPAAGVLLCAAVQVELYGTYDNLIHPDPFTFNGIDIALVQKLLLCLFFMVFLHRFEERVLPPLKAAASTSFAIFFLHPAVILLYGPRSRFDIPPWLLLPYKVTAVVLLCLGAAWAVKLLARDKSRYLIGW